MLCDGGFFIYFFITTQSTVKEINISPSNFLVRGNTELLPGDSGFSYLFCVFLFVGLLPQLVKVLQDLCSVDGSLALHWIRSSVWPYSYLSGRGVGGFK